MQMCAANRAQGKSRGTDSSKDKCNNHGNWCNCGGSWQNRGVSTKSGGGLVGECHNCGNWSRHSSECWKPIESVSIFDDDEVSPVSTGDGTQFVAVSLVLQESESVSIFIH